MAKYKSRAKRLDTACGIIRGVVDELESIRDDEDMDDEEKVKQANLQIGNVDYTDIECLKDEVESWKDNIEEKFSQTQKYSDLEECVSGLESALDQFQSLNDVESADDIDNLIAEIELGLDEAENVNFPGMYG